MTQIKHSTCLTSLVVKQEPPSQIQLIELSSQLIPNGNADFKSVRNFLPIANIIRDGIASIPDIRASLVMLIKNFSESLNVVRNLNELQTVEIAQMLIDECGDFRLEDYFVMFQLAKRGKIGDIRDRIDIQLVSKLLDEYWAYRRKEGEKLQQHLEDEMAENRKEQKRKALGSGESVDSVMSMEQFEAELKKIEEQMVLNKLKHSKSESEQRAIEQEMLERRKKSIREKMKSIYGFSDAQMEQMQNVRTRTFGSKVNQPTKEDLEWSYKIFGKPNG